MKYNPADQISKLQAITKFNQLIEGTKIFEIKTIQTRRSLSQNSYLHVCISLFAINFGYTLEESKTLLKRSCNFMTYENNGNLFLKASRKLNTKEMTDFIDFIRTFASSQGCYIPTAEQYRDKKYYFDNEIETHRRYL